MLCYLYAMEPSFFEIFNDKIDEEDSESGQSLIYNLGPFAYVISFIINNGHISEEKRN